MQELQAGDIEGVLNGILSSPEFQPPAPAPLWRALGAAWDWVWTRVGDLLGWLLPGLDTASPAWSLVVRVALVLLALVGVGVLLHLIRLGARSLRGPWRSRRARHEPHTGRTFTADDWEERARSAAAEERWRDAVMALYQAVIHRLAQEDRVWLDPGKTPGDYRRELSDDPWAGPLVDRFVRRWEPVAFGRRPAGRRSWHELLELARPLRERRA